MRPFVFARADSAKHAIEAHHIADAGSDGAVNARSQYVAGGTTLIDLMKLDVMRPEFVTDINALEQTPSGRIEFGPKGLWLGALVRMSQAADHPEVRENYPVIAQSLNLAASPQIRNMASLGGNVLQRTRCTYFRDVSYSACNKRNPGSGCAALEGFNRIHAILGTSEKCIATHPSDMTVALALFDAVINTSGPKGNRSIPINDFYIPYGDDPAKEN